MAESARIEESETGAIEESPEASSTSSSASSSVPKRRRLMNYSVEKKIDILKYAKDYSITQASAKFGVDRHLIRDWKKQEKFTYTELR